MNAPSLKRSWILIAKVCLLNIVATPLIFGISFLIFGGSNIDITNYSQAHYDFFMPWSAFNDFLVNVAIKNGLLEEFLWRFPIIMISWAMTWIEYPPKKLNLSRIVIILSAIVLNAFWAYGHVNIMPYVTNNNQTIFCTFNL